MVKIPTILITTLIHFVLPKFCLKCVSNMFKIHEDKHVASADWNIPFFSDPNSSQTFLKHSESNFLQD